MEAYPAEFSAVRIFYSRVAYKLGVNCYRADWLVLADFFLRQHLRATGQGDVITDRITTGCPNPTDYEVFEREFRAFLEDKHQAWEDGRVALPSYLLEHSSATVVNSVDRHSALVATPRYIMSSASYIENDFIDHYTRSLENVGVETIAFDSDGIAYGDIIKLDPDRAAADLRALHDLVASRRPEILLFDANFVGNDIGLNAAYVTQLRVAFGVKAVAMLSDAWGEHGVLVANYWAPVCDLVYHIAPGGAAERKSPFSEKLYCSPPPVNERNFHREEGKEFDLSFFGSYGTYLRPFWFCTVKRLIEPLRLRANIRTHGRTSDCPSMAEYASIMRRSRMVMNCSSRNLTFKAMTGRVWQALHAGTVLLEEHNAASTAFFVPFVHYAPFENARQLGHMIRFFKRNSDWADRLGQAASRFCAAHYSAAKIWAGVFGRL